MVVQWSANADALCARWGPGLTYAEMSMQCVLVGPRSRLTYAGAMAGPMECGRHESVESDLPLAEFEGAE